MTEPTKRPWGYVHHKGLDKHLVGGVLENVAIVEDRHGNAKENAEFIVKAVNSHDALVAEATELLKNTTWDEDSVGYARVLTQDIEALQAALEQVK